MHLVLVELVSRCYLIFWVVKRYPLLSHRGYSRGEASGECLSVRLCQVIDSSIPRVKRIKYRRRVIVIGSVSTGIIWLIRVGPVPFPGGRRDWSPPC